MVDMLHDLDQDLHNSHFGIFIKQKRRRARAPHLHLLINPKYYFLTATESAGMKSSEIEFTQ
jgi:hypothetical protein